MELLALIDLDNTLADYDRAKARAIEARNLTSSEISADLRAEIHSEPGFWMSFDPLEIGFRVVEILKELDYLPHILSKGPHNASNGWKEKFEWVRHHLGDDIGVTISTRKDIVRGACLVEDWPKFLGPWLEVNPDKFGILIDYESNRDFHHDRVIRVGSWVLSEEGGARLKKEIRRIRKFSVLQSQPRVTV